ncbi:hypothetical protein [Acidianus manzaensis]|uniref:Uncharacterized protein n=1 Tax=Acidianus manzaensis TaxID=282676 RepID=A0A1W6JXJ5_9CREN|nr:hypothetical protein [Acidianus manzaensis]ARM74965.1 hypothetical protein B6F84_02255 [Acidianus manzaensis]
MEVRIYKILTIVGIVLLLSSILVADLILQINSQSSSFTIPSSSTLTTTINPGSKVIVFSASGVVFYGPAIVNIHNTYIQLPNNNDTLTIGNNNSKQVSVFENIINIPTTLFLFIFPILFIGGILFIIGTIVLMYKRIKG